MLRLWLRAQRPTGASIERWAGRRGLGRGSHQKKKVLGPLLFPPVVVALWEDDYAVVCECGGDTGFGIVPRGL